VRGEVVLLQCEIYFSPDVVLYATASISSCANEYLKFRPATLFSLDYTRKSNSRLAEDWEFYTMRQAKGGSSTRNRNPRNWKHYFLEQ
jgi:hypothetical protein